jgi:hypothetical protein
MIQDNVMNGNELGPPSAVYVYITLRSRLALIERKLMKPILRRNKFVQPLVSGYRMTPHEIYQRTTRNVFMSFIYAKFVSRDRSTIMFQ